MPMIYIHVYTLQGVPLKMWAEIDAQVHSKARIMIFFVNLAVFS